MSDMTIQDYITEIETLWYQIDLDAPDLCSIERFNTMSQLLDRAMRHFPCSSDLWCIKGDILLAKYMITNQIPEFTERYNCYINAIRYNNNHSYAYESLGHLYHLHNKNLSESARYFQLAINLGAGPWSYIGLAEVLAETGRRALAIKCLKDATEKFGSDHNLDIAINQVEHGQWDPPAGEEGDF